jgi:ABC-type lipopolysaccharide export system ATPase subunit
MAANKPRKKAPARASTKRWSKRVTETSDALDLEASVFKQASARAIAASLKRSAERSKRRKSSPYRSALSMLTFYLNRGGTNISGTERRKLERAKAELRSLFGRAPAPA